MNIRHWVTLVLAVLLIAACHHGPAQSSALRALEGDAAGETPFVLTNLTAIPITHISIVTSMERTGTSYVSAEIRLDDGPIAPGQTAKFYFKQGVYKLKIFGHLARLFDQSEFRLDGPVQLVIYDDGPPQVAAVAGHRQVLIESLEHVRVKRENEARAVADAARATCEKRIATNQTPLPGKTRATGKWRCVIGGSFTGTDYVDLVQLADGHVTATVTGSDRSAAWTGVVIGDQVHFRWVGVASGGTLKLDPSGRAMSGETLAYTVRGRCVPWTLTCTR